MNSGVVCPHCKRHLTIAASLEFEYHLICGYKNCKKGFKNPLLIKANSKFRCMSCKMDIQNTYDIFHHYKECRGSIILKEKENVT